MIQARDQGYPKEKTAEMQLKIKVKWDVEIPVFSQETYHGSVSENMKVGSSVLKVNAHLALTLVCKIILISCNNNIQLLFHLEDFGQV